MAPPTSTLVTGPWAAFAAGVGGVMLGAGANVATWEPPGPPPPCPVVQAAPKPGSAPVAERPRPVLPAPVPVAPTAALTPEQVAVHVELLAAVGTSPGWPDDVPVAYRPDRVEAAVAAAVAACPDLEAAEIQLDCDEYPCMVWGLEPEGTDTWRALGRCHAWRYRVRSTTFMGSVDGDGRWVEDIRFPDDGFADEDQEVRRKYRIETWTPIVLEAWDLPFEGYR